MGDAATPALAEPKPANDAPVRPSPSAEGTAATATAPSGTARPAPATAGTPAAARSVGARQVQAMAAPGTTTVGAADDPAERAAEATADRVMRVKDPVGAPLVTDVRQATPAGDPERNPTVAPAAVSAPGSAADLLWRAPEPAAATEPSAGSTPLAAGSDPSAGRTATHDQVQRTVDEGRLPATAPAPAPGSAGSAGAPDGGPRPDAFTPAGPAPTVTSPPAAGALGQEPAETGTPAPEPEPPAPKGRTPAQGTPEVPADVQQYLEASRGQGAPLPDQTRWLFEARFGRPFDDVGIHDDAPADDASRKLDALAFTRGADIYFRADAYDPAAEAGQRLLAHELTHVVQQRSSILRVIRRTTTKSSTTGAAGTLPVRRALGGLLGHGTSVADAVKSKDPGDVKDVWIEDIKIARYDDRVALIGILAYQGWVGPRDRSKLEEIWGTFPTPQLVSTIDKEIVLWNYCVSVAPGLADLTAVTDAGKDFKKDISTKARYFLGQNQQVVEKEMARFGMVPTTDPNAAVLLAPAAPTDAQKKQLKEIQQAAQLVKHYQIRMQEMSKVLVGKGFQPFDPNNRPVDDIVVGPEVAGLYGRDKEDEQPGYTPNNAPNSSPSPNVSVNPNFGKKGTWDLVKAQWEFVNGRISSIGNAFPVIFAALNTVAVSIDVLATTDPDKDLAEAASALHNVQLVMNSVYTNIVRATKNIDDDRINPLDLRPVYEQLLGGLTVAGGTGRDWTSPFNHWVGRREVKERKEIEAYVALAFEAAEYAVLVASVLGTGGAAAFLAVSAAGVGVPGLKAALSADKYDALASANKGQVRSDLAIVDKKDVDLAKMQSEQDVIAFKIAVLTTFISGIGAGLSEASAIKAAKDDVSGGSAGGGGGGPRKGSGGGPPGGGEPPGGSGPKGPRWGPGRKVLALGGEGEVPGAVDFNDGSALLNKKRVAPEGSQITADFFGDWPVPSDFLDQIVGHRMPAAYGQRLKKMMSEAFRTLKPGAVMEVWTTSGGTSDNWAQAARAAGFENVEPIRGGHGIRAVK